MADHPHIVIGGGISGLSAAHYALQAGIDTRLLEASDRPGGCIHSSRFQALDGFWVEAGGHTCFNSYGNLLAIMEQLDLLRLTTAKEKRSYKLWVDGKRRGILSALHPFELLISLPGLFRIEKTGKTVAEYYSQVMGRKNYRELLSPALRSVVCQDADDFPAEAMFRKKPRRKDVLRAFTMPGGLADIPQAIAAQPGFNAQFGAQVTRIVAQGEGFALELQDGTHHSCERLTLAVPPPVAHKLLGEVAPAAASAIEDIGVAEIDTLVLAFERARLGIDEIAGLISVDGAFLSAVSRDFLPDDRYRGFAFHFPGATLSEAEREQAACQAIDARVADISAKAHVRNQLPALRADHMQRVQALDAALAGGRIAVTGNWFLGVSIEDCVTRTRAEHARLFGGAQGSEDGARGHH
ncbi:MAG: protoporphyrinogen/coproporphyrinogen oxidase [Halochromatium sp.]|uniref:protoporphyrinogen/coproporphyrinogen oxidase n=1 Tax=Halochromatium sp. TaxID=2049430 RepID=UPI00397BFD25